MVLIQLRRLRGYSLALKCFAGRNSMCCPRREHDNADGYYPKWHRQLGYRPACEMRLSQVGGRDDDIYLSELCRLPLPSGDHQPRRLAVLRFPLSLRRVEKLLAARSIIVSHETVCQWALKFGQNFANQIRRRLPAAGDKWHMDEVVLTIAGVKHWLWRAVDQNGMVLDILVQSRRDTQAAKRLLCVGARNHRRSCSQTEQIRA